jgi:hypothetical protein
VTDIRTQGVSPKLTWGGLGALVGGAIAAALNEWVKTANLPHPWGPIIDLLLPALLAIAGIYLGPAARVQPVNGPGSSAKPPAAGAT